MLTPSVSMYMTRQPWTIRSDASLAEAHAEMRAHHIRHLPVVDDARNLVGIVSVRDLYLLETLAASALDDATVAEAMQERPFVVTSDAPVDEVAAIMASGKYGSAVICGHDGVEGIFTTTDACRALADVLERTTEDALRDVPSAAARDL